MTTVVATREGIYTDTLCTYTVPFKTRKHERVGGSVYGGAGNLDDLLKFFAWRREGGDQPSLDESIDILEVCNEGIFMWDKQFARMWVNEDAYAIGSGAQYAMGAMAAGATPREAMKITARYDAQTGKQIEYVKL